MTDEKFSVIFRGDIVLGKNLPEVKQKLKTIFNVDNARIENLFAGKPISLKTKLSKNEAEKYKAVLKQAGIIVAIESIASDELAATKKISGDEKSRNADVVPHSKKDSAASQVSRNKEWRLAPVGSFLLEKKEQQIHEATHVNIDHLALAEQGGNLVKDDERLSVPRASVDIDILNWELTPYGEALLNEAEKKKTVGLDIDIASISLAEQVGTLLREGEKAKPVVVTIDVSHLELEPDKIQPPET